MAQSSGLASERARKSNRAIGIKVYEAGAHQGPIERDIGRY
jgi:hypothetical protein